MHFLRFLSFNWLCVLKLKEKVNGKRLINKRSLYISSLSGCYRESIHVIYLGGINSECGFWATLHATTSLFNAHVAIFIEFSHGVLVQVIAE